LFNHVLNAIGHLHYGGWGSSWQGDLRVGSVSFQNEQGDHHHLAWDESAVVAFAYELGFEEDPRDMVDDLPEELEDLCARASALLTDGQASSGLWAAGGGAGGAAFQVDPQPMSPEATLLRYTIDDEDNLVFSRDMLLTWIAFLSLDVEHAEVGAELARRAWKGPTEVLPDEATIVLKPPAEAKDRAPQAECIQQAKEMLASAGIHWR
jgi:hypothetical protein